MIHGCIVFHGFLPYCKFLGASRHLQHFYATTCKKLNKFRRFSTIARCHEDLNWYGLEKQRRNEGERFGIFGQNIFILVPYTRLIGIIFGGAT